MAFHCLRLTLLALLLSFLLSPSLHAQCVKSQVRVSPSPHGNTAIVCSNDGNPDQISFTRLGAASAKTRFVITNENFGILATSSANQIDFDAYPAGRYFVFNVSYEGNWLINSLPQPNLNIFSTRLAETCFQRSDDFGIVEVRQIKAGTISTKAGNTKVTECLEGGVNAVGFRATGSEGKQYVWLITDTFNRVKHLRFEGFHNFQYDGPGVMRVYGLAYTDALLIQPGEILSSKPLAAGCSELSKNFITVHLELVRQTSIRVQGNERLTIDTEAQARFTLQSQNPNRPGMSSTVVAIDRDRIIRYLGKAPAVDLSALPKGEYQLYEYVHTGAFYGQLGEALWERNPSARLAEDCFIISKNAIVIQKNTPASPPPCTANGGAMLALQATVTIQAGIARVSAIDDGRAVLPQGYDGVYLLTRSQRQVIEAYRTTAADFSVTATDTFHLYYFVGQFSSPNAANYFNLASLQLGKSTLAELQNRLSDTQICAAISQPGATVIVLPDPNLCTAMAGTLLPIAENVELINGQATLEATIDRPSAIPALFSASYVLTSGFNLSVLAVSNQPNFQVIQADNYLIHTLVAQTGNASAAQYIDLSTLAGESLYDLLDEWLEESICFDLDLSGAPFTVSGPLGACTAEAGGLITTKDTFLLSPGATVRLEASEDGSAVIPFSFDKTYLLTNLQGVVIGIGARARFTINALGSYRIHTWIGEFGDNTSPDFVNLNSLPIGSTTLADLLELYEISGKCGSIDEEGLLFTVLPATIGRQQMEWKIIVGSEDICLQAAPDVEPTLNLTSELVNYEIVLFDAQGRGVAKTQAREYTPSNVFQLSRSGLAAGVYFLSIRSAETQINRAIILQ